MGLLDRFRRPPAEPAQKVRGQSGDLWWPDAMTAPGFGGGLVQTGLGPKTENIPHDFGGYLTALKQSPPAFAAQNKRARYLSQMTFTWRNRTTKATFGSTALEILERPWPNGSAAELISRMEWHEGLAGNAYVFHNEIRRQLKVMRPDWVTIVLGSEQDPEDAANQLDAEVLAYLYTPGGLGYGGKSTVLLPEHVAHWSPLPDPAANFRGMSWVTPLVREVQGDIATAEHKLRFFENGATPNLVLHGLPAANLQEFKDLVAFLEEEHAGVANAYKTLYLGAGADATVVGANLKEIAFKEVQGAGETRIASVGEVPASLLGISEGMQGSSLNAGNYGEAKRSFVDGWLTSSMQSLVACLDQITPAPKGAQLWYSTTDMPLVREDGKDAAEIRGKDAQTLRNLLDAGYDPDAAVAFVQSGGDLSKLAGKHTGLFSVQLQKPGTKVDNPTPPTTEDTDDDS